MAKIIKNDRVKVDMVLDKIEGRHSLDLFIEGFIREYPQDYQRLVNAYQPENAIKHRLNLMYTDGTKNIKKRRQSFYYCDDHIVVKSYLLWAMLIDSNVAPLTVNMNGKIFVSATFPKKEHVIAIINSYRKHENREAFSKKLARMGEKSKLFKKITKLTGIQFEETPSDNKDAGSATNTKICED
jgi:hypothetical protein